MNTTATRTRRTTTTAVARPSSRLTTLNASDETAAQVLALSLGRVGWARQSDRDDMAQAVAVRALSLVGTEDEDGRTWDVLGAVRSVAYRVGQDYTRAMASEGVATFDPQDTDASELVDDAMRLAYWTPQAPDHIATTTTADRVADALETYIASAEDAREYSRRLAVADTAGRLTATGRMPRELADADVLADLADAFLYARTLDAYRYGAWTHGTWTETTTALAEAGATTTHGLPVHRATFSQAVTEATAPVAMRAPLVLTLAGMQAWARTHAPSTTTTADRTTYAPTTEDRHADDWAELSTPLAAVNKPSSVKRKRDGSVGGSTTMARRRGVWDGRKA